MQGVTENTREGNGNNGSNIFAEIKGQEAHRLLVDQRSIIPRGLRSYWLLLSEGLLQKQACLPLGICENTLASWCEKHPDLALGSVTSRLSRRHPRDCRQRTKLHSADLLRMRKKKQKLISLQDQQLAAPGSTINST